MEKYEKDINIRKAESALQELPGLNRTIGKMTERLKRCRNGCIGKLIGESRMILIVRARKLQAVIRTALGFLKEG